MLAPCMQLGVEHGMVQAWVGGMELELGHMVLELGEQAQLLGELVCGRWERGGQGGRGERGEWDGLGWQNEQQLVHDEVCELLCERLAHVHD